MSVLFTKEWIKYPELLISTKGIPFFGRYFQIQEIRPLPLGCILRALW